MEGLDVPNPRFVGAFRGESGLESIQVRVGSNFGVDSAKVAEELTRFEAKLQTLVANLDALVPIGQAPDLDQLAAIIDLCAWVHAEWVRIHPFANGNGRAAPLWANSIAMRYGVPPLSVCARDQTQVMEKPELRRCGATGNQLRLSFAAYLMIF
jgi:Fic family protein